MDVGPFLTVYVRGSVQVKLVAALDVEHEIPSIQILHHKEQVLLDTKMQRGQGRRLMRKVGVNVQR